ncbi:MAG TPA: hypothetical protein VGK94_07860 [Candidatus Polarisedimenticolia bacterium]|jgi:hypothetical protein
MSNRVTSRKLICQLSPEEKNTFADEQARLLHEYAELERQAAAIAKGYREDLEKKWERMKRVADIVDAGKEERNIDCRTVPDHTAKTVIYRPLAEGLIVLNPEALERPMTDDEMQGLLSFEEPEEAAAPIACAVCSASIELPTDSGADNKADLSCLDCHFGPLCEGCYTKACELHHAPVPVGGDQADAGAGEVAHA